MRRALFQVAAAAPLALSMGNLNASAIEAVTSMFSKKIKIRVSVVDEQGRPVPHATLWFLYASSRAPERSIDDMSRLVKRYQRDYDIASVGTVDPIGAVLTHQANEQGIFENELEENVFGGLTALPVIVGALKRGFEPTTYAATVPVGASRDIVLKMRKSADQSFDPRLLELDEIRSEVGNVFPNWTEQDRLAHVDRMNARLLRLAKTFEQEGKRHEAALAYYNLAYLPSIDRMVMADGKERVIGYTRGYDEKSSTRKAYLSQALALGQEIPQLRCRSLVDAFVAKGGRVWADQSKASLRRQLIADLEDCLKRADGRVFPWVLHFLSQTYSYVGEPEKACETLQRAYRFEPAAFEAAAWPGLFDDVERRARKPAPGLPAFPDFICKMAGKS